LDAAQGLTLLLRILLIRNTVHRLWEFYEQRTRSKGLRDEPHSR